MSYLDTGLDPANSGAADWGTVVQEIAPQITPEPVVDTWDQQIYAPAAPVYEDVLPPSYDQQIYAPAPPVYQDVAPMPAYSEPVFTPVADAPFDWAPQPTSEDLAQSEGLQEYLFGDPMNVAPEWYESKGMPYHPSQLDPWEAPSNFSVDEAFSTISGDDIGGGRGTTGMFNPEAQLDPSQVQDRRYLEGDRLLNPDFGGQAMNQGRRGAEIILDALGMNPFGNTRPVNPYQALNPETGEPLDPSLYQQFGFGTTGKPLNSASRSILSNPQFAESNAQFDATTNPANRGGVGILGGLGNLAGAGAELYNTDIPVWSDFARDYLIPGVEAQANLMNPLTWVDNPLRSTAEGVNRFGAESVVPVTAGDAALTLGPGLAAARQGGLAGGLAEAFGTGLTRPDEALEALPPSALRGAARRFPESPGMAPDVANALRRAAGASDEVGDAARISEPGTEALNGSPRNIADEAAAPAPSFPRLADESDLEYAVRLRTSGLPADQIRAIERANAEAAGQEEQRLADLSSGFYKEQGTLRNRAKQMSQRSDRFGAVLGPTPEDPATTAARQTMQDLAKVEGKGTTEDAIRNLINDAPIRIGNELRQATAGLDVSNMLRQGWGTIRHGTEYLASLGDLSRGLTDEAYAFARNKEIREGLGAKAGLFIADLPGETVEAGSRLTRREENYASDFIGKLPVYKQSGRANALFLNAQRDRVFNRVMDSWQRTAESVASGRAGPLERFQSRLWREGDVEALANYVNRATGRGTLGPMEETWVDTVLGAGIFSPRFQASRPQMVASMFNYKHPLVAIEAIKDFTTSFGATVSLLALANQSGLASVELDPRDADFGQFRIGNTRIDPWAGLRPFANLAARLYTGEYAGGFPAEPNDLLVKFVRSKTSPLAGRIWDVAQGEDFLGRDVTPEKLATSFLPIFAQGLYEAAQEGLLGEALAALPASFFGLGTNTYPESDAEKRSPELQSAIDLYFDADNDAFDVIKASNPSGPYAPLLRESKNLDEFNAQLREIVQEANRVNPRINVDSTMQRIREELGITAAKNEVIKTAIRRNPDLLKWIEESGEYDAAGWMYDYRDELAKETVGAK